LPLINKGMKIAQGKVFLAKVEGHAGGSPHLGHWQLEEGQELTHEPKPYVSA
jgi:hypothetical protein